LFKLAEQELVSTEESSQQKSELQSAEQALNAQERMFCYEYLTDYDHCRAATAVNRSADAGRKLLRNPKITHFIKLLSDELAADSLITRDMVQYELLHGYLPRAKGDVAISGVDRDGVEFSAKVTNMAAYGKAIDMMAKHSGFTAPEIVAGGLTININHEAMGITVKGEYSEQQEQSTEESSEAE
jgi:hypothetical protein